ncbi:MAG: response regulator [Caldiserica bacterium]|nr:MAG: response regulator [Caldisericota bacterium]
MEKKQKSILVIDDESDVCEILEQFLVQEGYRVYLAFNGDEGIKKYIERRPDGVLLDIALPGKNGIEVLRELKKIDPDCNVIMITAYRDAEKVVEAFRLGAYDCIFKPFDFDYLRKALMAKLI